MSWLPINLMDLKDNTCPCPPILRESFVVCPVFPRQACKSSDSLYLLERMRSKFLDCISYQIIFILKLTGIQLVDIPKMTGTLGPHSSILKYYMQSFVVFKIGWINFISLKRLFMVQDKGAHVFLILQNIF